MTADSNQSMVGVYVTILFSTLILVVGTWLYLRRRRFTPRERILLFLLMYVLLVVSGPAIVWKWHRGHSFVLTRFSRIWLAGVFIMGIQFLRFWRNKGELGKLD